MAKDYDGIDESLRQWISKQQVFFVATAPLTGDGLVNCSPKGLDGLRVTGPRQLVYADYGGSGIETVAHIKENGRITLMMCAFTGAPKIFRFFGRGRAVEQKCPEFAELKALFPEHATIRNFVVIDVDRIRDACGFGVPVYAYEGERDALQAWQSTKSDEEMASYHREKNAVSLDGLPGLDLD